MIHLNGHLIAAVDVETTGFYPGYHDVVQVAALLLNDNLEPHSKVQPFYMDMRPKRPENIDKDALKVSRLDFAYLMQRAADPYDAAEQFEEWFEKMIRDGVLPERKKIIPLAQNWVFDRPFIGDWLGWKTYEYIFHPWYRDTLPVAQYLNDRHGFDVTQPEPERVPFPKANLGYICSQLKVRNAKAHDALQDCVATAECYKRLCFGQLPAY